MKQLYILAGANGSGKSTISKVLLPEEGIVYVNPDDIARKLNPSDPPAAKTAAGNVYTWDPTESVATRPLSWNSSTSQLSTSQLHFYTHDGNKNVSEIEE